ncbi:hypothetical protein AGJ34_20325 [Cronobacter dublinensis subsp. dublinensis]|nr:hypothetical protein [Cronobacter dublinensis subsp. dublinensis]EGT5729932.1 hypothetical protein [Cronobacter dublinensis subsp. dublinensis]
MKREWILSFSDVHRCLLQSLRYPILSRNTMFASFISVMAFIVCWLTLAGVPEPDNTLAAVSLAVLYFLVVVVFFCWSINMREFHRPAAATILTCFFLNIISLNISGDNMFDVIASVITDSDIQGDMAVRLFNSLGDLIESFIVISLWPGFYWLALSIMLLAKFRTDLIIFQGMLRRLLMNLPVLIIQIFVFASLSVILLLMTSITRLPLMLMPLMAVWNCVFIFLVIVRIENGTPPDMIVGQIARVKLTLRK